MEDEPMVRPRPPSASRFVRHVAPKTSFGICAGCGARISGDRCEGCGKPLLQPEAPAPVKHGEASPFLSALRGALLGLVIGGFVLLLALYSPPPTRAPSLGGIHVGDPSAKVAKRLGRPERTPHEVIWSDSHGDVHRLGFWQYGLDKETAPDVADLTITFLDDKVYQVGSLDASFATSEGLRVGDRTGKANRLYGTAIEEDRVSGLVPLKYLHNGVVVKVIVMPGDDQVLAIGLESPKGLPLAATSAQKPSDISSPPAEPLITL